MAGLTHIDAQGNAVMVDVGGKEITDRVAVAKGIIRMQRATFDAIAGGTAKKGDVLGVARVAGIMAAKRTSELIPLCHPLMLTKCTVDFKLHPDLPAVEAICTAQVSGKTGVEMEALTGVSTALLTIYDMCKAVQKDMVIRDVRLVHKSGGRTGTFERTFEIDGIVKDEVTVSFDEGVLHIVLPKEPAETNKTVFDIQ